MAESTVDILIRARDQATQTINQAMSRLNQATLEAARSQGQLVSSSGQAERATVSFSRQVSGAASSGRFLAFTMLNEVSPALGTAGSRLASLATVATLSGTAVGALATVAIGGLIIALSKWISEAKKAKEAQEELTKAVSSASVAFLTKTIAESQKEIEGLQRRITLLRGLQQAGIGSARELATAQLELAEALGRQEKANVGLNLAMKVLVETQAAAKDTKDQEEGTKRLTSATEALGMAYAAAAEKQTRFLITAKAALSPEQVTSILHGSQQVIAESERKARENLEEEAEKAAEFTAGESAERIDKIFREIRKRSDTFVNAMTSLGNAGADALFDGLIGRSRNLAQVFSSFLEGVARDIFRNTFVKAFGGETRGLSLQNLLSLGGGGSPFGRTAAVAAGVPGVSPSLAGLDVSARGAISDRLVFGPSPEEIAEMARAGVPLPGGLTFGQLGGGLAGVGLGALGILGARRAGDPLSGGIAGGLGGYALGSGLGTLFQAGSYIPYIGAAFAVAGGIYGLISGQRNKAKQRREEARQRRAQAQILVVEGADTLEELEALSQGIPVPSRRFGTIIQGLEPEAMAALRDRARGLILQAGEEEIAGTRSLERIEAILARGVSPDVGGLELRAGAERRRLEILGDLEAIEAIGIEEQLPGGVRRRTIVGAGAFGLSRARQGEAAGLEIILNRPGFLRTLVQQLSERPELLAMLARAIRGNAQATDFRIEDLEALV